MGTRRPDVLQQQAVDPRLREACGAVLTLPEALAREFVTAMEGSPSLVLRASVESAVADLTTPLELMYSRC